MINIAMHLPRHDHHPKKEDRIHQLERESRAPAITCPNQR
jgi:hypothetical protein